jgi:hypothetical protein
MTRPGWGNPGLGQGASGVWVLLSALSRVGLLGTGGNVLDNFSGRDVGRRGCLVEIILGNVAIVAVAFVRFAASTTETHSAGS